MKIEAVREKRKLMVKDERVRSVRKRRERNRTK